MTEKNSLLIHKIEINNCGGFRGSHELEFSTDPEKNITVIQAASGRGKSTSFQLIYWCLYGEFFKPQSNTTLDDEGLINLPSLNELQLGKKVTGSVSLTVNDENGELYVLTRSATATKLRDENGKKFDKLNNSRINSGIQIETDCKLRLKDEKEGGMFTERDDSLINAEIRSYLPKDLSDFVLFDGEKLMKFQNSNDSKEIIMDGIQKLSGLPVVDSLIESTTYTKQEIKKLVARKTGGADGEALARALQDVQDDIEEQEKIRETNKGLLSENRIRYNELQEIMAKTKAGKNIQVRINKKENDVKNLKKIQNKINDEIRQFLFKNIPYLLIRNTLLESQKDFGRLEELQKIPPSITSEGIDKLRNALKCVCGRDFEENDTVWDELGRVKETIIDSDMVSSISQGRGLISQIVDQSNPEKIRQRYDELEDNEIDITRQLKMAKTELAEIYEERRHLPSSGTETYEQLDKKSRDLFTGIGKIQSKIEDAQEQLLTLEDDKTNLNKKYEDAVSHGEKFQDDKDKVTILNAIEKLSKAKKKEISDILRDTAEKATNEYFMMSAPQKEEFDKVMITSNYDILAVDENENTKLTSMGQSHVLGLSYVFGCRSITEKNTFLFIDSPLHNISGEFRNEVAEVLAKYLPNVQIVLFVTDTEYTNSGPLGEIPVRDILKPTNKIWKEYAIELCKTEDGNTTRCFKEMK